MTQEDFNLFITKNIGDLPFHEQEDILRMIEYKWLPEFQSRLSKTIANKELRMCSYCHQYFSTIDSKVVKEQEFVKDAIVNMDFDSTDNDILADVWYEKEFFICPHCMKKNLRRRNNISESNRHKRNETVPLIKAI